MHCFVEGRIFLFWLTTAANDMAAKKVIPRNLLLVGEFSHAVTYPPVKWSDKL